MYGQQVFQECLFSFSHVTSLFSTFTVKSYKQIFNISLSLSADSLRHCVLCLAPSFKGPIISKMRKGESRLKKQKEERRYLRKEGIYQGSTYRDLHKSSSHQLLVVAGWARWKPSIIDLLQQSWQRRLCFSCRLKVTLLWSSLSADSSTVKGSSWNVQVPLIFL